MAEIVVSVKYPNPRTKFVFWLIVAFMPLWAVFMPILCGCLIFATIFSGVIAENIRYFMGLFSSCALTSVIGSLLFVKFADKSLLLSHDGLRLPGSSVVIGKREFQWSELSGVRFVGNLANGKDDFSILISRKDGNKSVSIFGSRLSYDELEQLILALELWSEPANMDERLPMIKDELQVHLRKKLSSDSNALSYTEIWEDELERRFNSTAFLVLDPDATLRGGELVVVRQLAFGGLSAIYLCQQNKRELVVLKESAIPADSSEDLRQKAEQMFAREAKLLMKLDHPHVVKVKDYFVERGRNYMLLEHVNGPDLRQFVIKQGALTEQRTLLIAKTLAEVLKYLHEREPGIIHRDFTPDNVVLENNHVVKVIDFGAANEFIGTATGTLVGKQSYLPIEQLRGKAVPQSDIYAFGCTLFFLLTGEDPEPLAVPRVSSLKPTVSEALDDLIASCTDPDYKKRPANAAEILDKLAAHAT